MKSDLLNSIYQKHDSQHDFNNTKDLMNFYVNKIHLLYVDALDKAGIENLDQKIKVTTKFDDGYVLTNVFNAGHHIIDVVFDSEDYSKNLENLDKTFLQKCTCPDKEDLLEKIKHIIAEIGSETIDKQEWLKELDHLKTC